MTSNNGGMLSRDEGYIVAAIMKSLGIDEIFLPRELLTESFGGSLYLEEDFKREGFTIRIGEY